MSEIFMQRAANVMKHKLCVINEADESSAKVSRAASS